MLDRIRKEKKTGALTLHFSQGSPSGTSQWDEKQTSRLTNKRESAQSTD